MSIKELSLLYEKQKLKPERLIDLIFDRIEALADYNIWISVADKELLKERARILEEKRNRGERLPLYGIPYSVKDNIDVAGMPTTAACPAYAYVPGRSAEVVERLEEAGALLIGKTNLDQFATGLVGTRSPYGAVKNAYHPGYIAGGSSSGSAVSVAKELCAFSIGTDTAGSGRVPAGFNHIVGLKPSIGKISTEGVVPACKSLDCIAVFARNVADAAEVYRICSGENGAPDSSAPPADAFGIPAESDLQFFGNKEYEQLYNAAVEDFFGAVGPGRRIDFVPFREAAKLLYEGPWIAERMAAIKDFYSEKNDAILDVTRKIIEGAFRFSATDAFEAMYKLDGLKKIAQDIFSDIDFLLVPTAPTIYRMEEVVVNDIELNANLGYYTNFVNLLDLCALSIPYGFQRDGAPMGLTMIAPATKEGLLIGVAEKFTQAMQQEKPANTREPYVLLGVAGLHLSGEPLNYQLTEIGATLVGERRTSRHYQMYLIEDGVKKPGLVRSEHATGVGLPIEVWRAPRRRMQDFAAKVKPPLRIGPLELENGEVIQGFVCDASVAGLAPNITAYGGWRAFVKKPVDDLRD